MNRFNVEVEAVSFWRNESCGPAPRWTEARGFRATPQRSPLAAWAGSRTRRRCPQRQGRGTE